MDGRRFLRDWTAAFTVGELVGFVPPALVGAWLGSTQAGDAATVIGLTLAGALEGASIGTAQAFVLGRHDAGVPRARWVAATAAGAALAWFVGMGGAAVMGAASSPVVLVALIPAWLVGLAAMGAFQWLLLRRRGRRTWHWIPVSAGAWLVGVLIPVAAISLTPDDWPAPPRVLVAVLSAVAMGLVVGLLTGRVMRRLVAGDAGGADGSESAQAR